MSILDYFKPVSTWTAEKIRQFMKEKNPGDYNLADVRQPKEYEKGHLPGAKLIPLGELKDRLFEVDPDKPTIVYWAAGVRSRAAAAVLSGAGLKNVYSVEGGINAWEGLRAEGLPDSGMAYFADATRPEELMTLAWYLEKGSQTFYSGLSQRVSDSVATDLFKELAVAEEHHQASLSRLYQDVKGPPSASGFPESIIPSPDKGELMEGGMRVSEALEWARGREIKDILDLSMSLEANAYDLHLRMKARIEDPRGKEVFARLSREERGHLDRLSSLLEQKT